MDKTSNAIRFDTFFLAAIVKCGKLLSTGIFAKAKTGKHACGLQGLSDYYTIILGDPSTS